MSDCLRRGVRSTSQTRSVGARHDADSTTRFKFSTGIDPEVLRVVLANKLDAMPPDVALAWRFTRATLAHDPAADDYREVIFERWGRRAVISLAFAITAARMYPTVKYARGHGKACMRVVVGGTPVRFEHGWVQTPVHGAAHIASAARVR